MISLSFCHGQALIIASGYWAFLDFALAFIPVDIVWKLQMKLSKKFLLSLLLSMGVLYVFFTSVLQLDFRLAIHIG